MGGGLVRSVGFTMLGIFYASLVTILLTDAPTAPLRRVIDNPVLRFFGKYSYGIYVIHFIIAPTMARWFPEDIILARAHSYILASLFCILGKTTIAVTLALVSWNLLEAPCLRLKDRFNYSSKKLPDPAPVVLDGAT
jgi:peptidoglycan/LPS O-acetylase OafA/YrhL